MSHLKPINIAELRARAKSRLPRMVFDYIDGGAQDEVTLKRNRSDFEKYILVPRVLVNVEHCDLGAELFGRPLSMPLLLAPTGLTGLVWPNGEVHAARAASEAGIGFCLSSNATTSIEELGAAIEGPFWFQIYMMKDRKLTKSMIERAAAMGCDALILTVDLAVGGRRERDIVNGFTVPPSLGTQNILNFLSKPAWLRSYLSGPAITFQNYPVERRGPLADMARFIAEQLDQSATWDDVAWVKSIFKGPVLLKGILSRDDAERSIECGADGIIVSNHGGRQLDGVSSAIDALPGIAEEVAGRIPILMDGGVRRGVDIAKARALGATACLIGRPFLYGLAVSGQYGVKTAIELLRAEYENTLALLGIPSSLQVSCKALGIAEVSAPTSSVDGVDAPS